MSFLDYGIPELQLLYLLRGGFETFIEEDIYSEYFPRA
jgi:hypothetical protein